MKEIMEKITGWLTEKFQHPLSLLFFVFGALLILIGVSTGLNVPALNQITSDPNFRWASLILGIVFCLLSVFIYYRPPNQNPRSVSQRDSGSDSEGEAVPPATNDLHAEQFFYTIDDRPRESFPIAVQGAVRIQILARTAVNLLNHYEKVFEQLARAGCEIQFLFIDPSCEVSQFLYGSNPDVYRNNIKSTSQHLRRLKSIMGHRLQVRVTKYVLTSSVMVIEKHDMSQSAVQVQLYFLHSAFGADRPIFKVNYGDKWYDVFRDEFAQLWLDSVDWDLSLVPGTAN